MSHAPHLGNSAGPLPASGTARLLVASPWGLGEAVIVRILVQGLSARFPALKIGVLVGHGASAEVMSLGGHLHRHRYSDRVAGGRLWGSLRSIAALRRAGYQTALDCDLRSAKTAAFLRAVGVPVRIGFAGLPRSPRALFLTHRVEPEASSSYWESLVALARHIDPHFPTTAPRLSLPSDATVTRRVVQWLGQQVAPAPTRMLALHLGSAENTIYRRWPVSRFIELAKRIQAFVPRLLVVLTGTPAERDLVEEFASGFRGHCADATTFGSVHSTALLLEKCDLLVSNDTGVMHLGAALGTPTVGLFGPNSPRHWGPVGTRAIHVYQTRVHCSPCMNSFRGVYPHACRNPEYQRCLLDIEPAHVLEAARNVVREDWLG